jgi:hypothetical protein
MADIQYLRDQVRVAQDDYFAARERYENCDAENQWDRLRVAVHAADARLQMAKKNLWRVLELPKAKPKLPDPAQPELL